MSGEIHGEAKKRIFNKVNFEPVSFSLVFSSKKNIFTANLDRAITKNLSHQGLLFLTQNPPPLHNLLIINTDYLKTETWKDLPGQVEMIEGRPLAKVVRLEAHMSGDYEVGVLFINKSEELAGQLQKALKRERKYRLFSWITKFTLAIFAIFAILSINVIYLEHKNLYQPPKKITLTPSSINLKYDNVYFNSVDKRQLNGWFIPAEGAKATVLFCHGRGENLSDNLSTINFFHKKAGLNFFIFDYRGFGKSSGRPSEGGLYKDAEGAYDYLSSRKDIDTNKIIVVGESLGGAVAADLCLKRKVQALVLESTFVSLVMEANELYPFLPNEFLLLDKFDTISKIKKIKIPKLIMHGYDDEVVSFYNAQLLYNAALPPKQFLPFEGGHSDDVYKLSTDYRDKFVKFLVDNRIIGQDNLIPKAAPSPVPVNKITEKP